MRLAAFLAVCLIAAGPTLAVAQPPKPIPKPVAPTPAPKPLPKPKAAPKPLPKPAAKPPARPPARPKAAPRAPAKPRLMIPATVGTYLSELCGRSGGRPVDPEGALQLGDFNGDGLMDYFVDQHRLRCTNGAPPARGTLAEAALFTGQPGSAGRVLHVSAWDSSVEREGELSWLLLVLDGDPCGFAPRRQRCRLRLDYDASRRQFRFGERVFVDRAGAVMAEPAWIPMAPDLAKGFAEGKFRLGDGPRGGCKKFYEDAAYRSAMRASYEADDWNSLVRQVTGPDCDSDLGWFFLGVAAENFGKREAAVSYYRTALKRTNLKSLNYYKFCRTFEETGGCFGIDIQAQSERALARLAAP